MRAWKAARHKLPANANDAESTFIKRVRDRVRSNFFDERQPVSAQRFLFLENRAFQGDVDSSDEDEAEQ